MSSMHSSDGSSESTIGTVTVRICIRSSADIKTCTPTPASTSRDMHDQVFFSNYRISPQVTTPTDTL